MTKEHFDQLLDFLETEYRNGEGLTYDELHNTIENVRRLREKYLLEYAKAQTLYSALIKIHLEAKETWQEFSPHGEECCECCICMDKHGNQDPDYVKDDDLENLGYVKAREKWKSLFDDPHPFP